MPIQIITHEHLTTNIEKARLQQDQERHREYPEVEMEKPDDPNVTREAYRKIISAAVSTGLGPLVGIRRQEDRFSIKELQELETLTPIVIAQVFNDALLEVSERCQSCKAGSTYIGSLLWDQYIITANIGDSYALLLSRDEERRLQAHRLSWAHKPADPEEHKRIEAAGGIVGRDLRLNGRFSVSRAIGDAIEPAAFRAGLISLPSLSLMQLPAQGGTLILGSDGLSDVVSSEEIARFFERSDPIGEEEFANALRSYAFKKGSTDNTTVIVATVPPRIEDSRVGVLLSVADGHGGDEVAEYLRQHFADIFKQKIHQRVLQPTLDETQDEIQDLGDNDIGADGVRALKEALKPNQTLTSIVMSSSASAGGSSVSSSLSSSASASASASTRTDESSKPHQPSRFQWFLRKKDSLQEMMQKNPPASKKH